MRILWITNIPSPYRVKFFEKLGEMCELIVVFEKNSSQERNSSWSKFNFVNFKGIVLKGKEVDVDKAISFSVINYLKKGVYDHIVISNVASPTGIIAIAYMKFFKIPYIIEGDGGVAKSGRGFKEIMKKHLIKNATAYFSTGKIHDLYYIKYGAKDQNIYRYPFTSIDTINLLQNRISKNEKLELKRELGISEALVVLSIGQFIHRKGFDVLLKASDTVNKDASIYIIGGDPTSEYQNIISSLNLNNVNFRPFMPNDSILKWLRAADLFVLPTREDIWGLVINEAMASGLPIITTDKCIAGLELIENDINGYIVEVENPYMLAHKINEVLADEKLRERMANSNIKKAKEYTYEKMALRHMELFNKLK